MVIVLSWLLVAAGGMADTADEALALAQKTLTYVEKSGKRPAMAAELDALIKRLPQAKKIGTGIAGKRDSCSAS